MPDTFTTTADEVLAGIDLTRRQIVITGATAGLGLAAARAFARAGADIVLIGRDAAKLAAAQETVDADGSGTITTEHGDLADLNAVAELAEKLKASLSRLDVLVLNAGIMAAPLERSPQGHEMHLAVSHLGHHLLTTALIDLLKASKARVIALSSSGHGLAPFDFDDPDFTTRDYDKWAAYGQAKTATALFAGEMANRFGNDGIVTVAVHPGVIKTQLQRHLSEAEEEYVLQMSAERGGDPHCRSRRGQHRLGRRRTRGSRQQRQLHRQLLDRQRSPRAARQQRRRRSPTLDPHRRPSRNEPLSSSGRLRSRSISSLGPSRRL